MTRGRSPPGCTNEGYELRAARPQLLKTTLGRERLLELLSDEIDAGTDYLRKYVERFAGEGITGTHGPTRARRPRHRLTGGPVEVAERDHLLAHVAQADIET